MSLELGVMWMAGVDTFIFAINGQVTIGELQDIEKDLCDNEMSWSYPECTELTVQCTLVKPWDDYGSGYGDILHWPGYWDLTVISTKTSEEFIPSAQGDTENG